MTTGQAGGKLWNLIRDNWAVLATIGSISIGGYLKLDQHEYRILRAEKELEVLKADFRDNLKEINGATHRMELQITELVTIQKQAARGNK